MCQLNDIRPLLKAINRMAEDDKEIKELSKLALNAIDIVHNDIDVMCERLERVPSLAS